MYDVDCLVLIVVDHKDHLDEPISLPAPFHAPLAVFFLLGPGDFATHNRFNLGNGAAVFCRVVEVPSIPSEFIGFHPDYLINKVWPGQT
jgi:hypothetical protein